MTHILGISGSLRQASFNTALLRAAQSVVKPGVTLDIATLHGIPLYDGDVEDREGIPDAVNALKERIVASDGVLLVSPEYNNSVPGTFKNAIDWLSRPSSDIARIFNDRPFGLIGTSPGRFGTVLGQNAWLPVLRTLGVRYWMGGRLTVSRAEDVFDGSGGLKDEAIRAQLTKYVAGFSDFASR